MCLTWTPSALTGQYRAANRANETQLKRLRLEFDAMKEAVFAAADDRFRRFSEHYVSFHQLILEAANNDRQAQPIQDLRFATMT